MARPILLLVAALLAAGCTSDPPPLSSPSPTYHDDPRGAVAPGYGLAPLEWRTLYASDFAITPATPLTGSLDVPNGTVQVLVNLTLTGGAAYGIAISLGDCTWRRDLALVGDGGVAGADCGGVAEGTAALSVGITAGALVGSAEVVGILCDAKLGRCPGRLPPTTS